MKLIASGPLVLLACSSFVTNVAIPQARGPTSREIQDNAKSAAMNPASSHSTELADLEAWLERLKGRFTIKGKAGGNSQCFRTAPGLGDDSMACAKLEPNPITYDSEVECLSVGNGVGVRCVFKQGSLSAASLRSAQEYDSIARSGDLSNLPVDRVAPGVPVRAVFGMDPVARKISVMIVSNMGYGSGGAALLEGDTVTIKGSCRDLAVIIAIGQNMLCDYTMRIEAPADGQVVRYRGSSSSLVANGLSTSSRNNSVLELHRVDQHAERKDPEAPPVSR